ncbi:diaminopimelate decarboxylase [Thermoflavifilum aggregans]|uniref:Diaminopimelate decarboxylase n=1 Tax=Thermoflavifilum aggregans TaxID=454188 RepID=A0A2M9CXI0_9BACT|nr:diaminopimelate decarboxylase [Thermoflavifilum aggregans]PJJ76603.1 diaminopimelate decarboxylase [Thermoflavifilum aggregans]
MARHTHADVLPGQVLMDIAHQFGTPVYVYHAEKIQRQYEKMKKAFQKAPVQIYYACKALTNINILKLMRQLGAGLDTVSIQEVQLGLRAGFEPQQIIFTPNCVDLDEMIAAKELGVKINIDNISILEQFGNRFGGSYPVCIRLNPHINAGGHYKISTGHIDSKFGISIHQIRHIERIVKSTGLHVNGLHMHTGSEIKDVDVFLRGVEILLDMAQHFDQLDFIDLGSGFKVAYHPDDTETDIDLLGEKLSTLFNQFAAQYHRPLTLCFEPGKYLVSQAGYFVVKVNVIKQTLATVFAGVNSGFNHLIRPMFYDAYHMIRNISNPKGPERIYTVVGYICETDTFAWDRKINEIREGDLLVFYNAGAYGFEMSSNYNSRLRPAEVLVKDNQYHLIRSRETIDDLLRNQIEVLD